MPLLKLRADIDRKSRLTPGYYRTQSSEMNTEFSIKSFLVGVLIATLFISTAGIIGGVVISKLRSRQSHVAASAVPPQSWEYQVLRGRPPSEMQDRINMAAAEGWELVSALPYTDSAYAVMRRLKK